MQRISGRVLGLCLMNLVFLGSLVPALGAVQIVATTTIAADVVSRVGGDLIELTVLLPVGADPHAFEPTPQDLVALARADAVALHGAGLEGGWTSLIEAATGIIIDLSEGVPLRTFDEDHDREDHGHDEVDPHTWFDPRNVGIWADTVAHALTGIDPANASTYQGNAAAYRLELEALDRWIIGQVNRIPDEDRRLVTDHTVFGYFADRYGFEQVGAIFPGFSTVAEPSARELATLQDAIRALDVHTLFIGTVFAPALAEQLAADTGTNLVLLYTGSLSEPGGPASTYLEMMRYNVEAIVGGLTSDD